MSSCCRGNDKDPDLEFFDLVDNLILSISNRPTQSILNDAKSNVRWNKYTRLKTILDNISLLTDKDMK